MYALVRCKQARPGDFLLLAGKKKNVILLLSCLPFSQQFVRGYMEILGKDCHLVVRNETAALFDAQNGQVAALHAQELEPACKGGLGEPLTGAELSYFRAYDVFGSTIPVDFHRRSLLKMKYMN